jgi:phosphomannomutase
MLVRTKVGEINVAEKMKEIDAIIGGEGNGGVILPELHTGRDAPVAVALTLQHLLESGQTLRDLYLSMPQYKIVKQKINIEGMDPDNVLETMAEKYKNEEISLLDGMKIDFPTSWVHLRKSNTEPIIRIISEAETEKEARELGERFMSEIRALM